MDFALLRDVTQDEFEAYARDGAVLLRSILPPDLVNLISAGVEESYAQPGALSSRLVPPEKDGETRMDQVPSLSNAKLGQVVMASPLAGIAAALLGRDTVHHVLDQMFFKPAGRIMPTAWHQDTPYLRVKGEGLCRLWMPCDPSPAELTVSVVRGSHLWGVEFRPVEPEDVTAQEENIGGDFSYDGARFDQSLPKVPKIADHPDSFDTLSWDANPGDVLAFNGNILHGTTHEIPHHPNPRRAFAVLWGDPDVQSIVRPGHAVPDAATARGYDLPDGVPISTHPHAYPVRTFR